MRNLLSAFNSSVVSTTTINNIVTHCCNSPGAEDDHTPKPASIYDLRNNIQNNIIPGIDTGGAGPGAGPGYTWYQVPFYSTDIYFCLTLF